MTRLGLIVLHLLIGLSAIGAGQALALKPTGEALAFKTECLAGSSLSDYRVLCFVQHVVVARSIMFGALAEVQKDRRASLLSTGSGTILVLWMLLQTLFIGFQHWSQGIWAVLFPLKTALGAL